MRGAVARRRCGWLPVTKREFLLKDLRLFFRDTTQWSQLILLAVLLLVYVFNIRRLPIHSGEQIPFSLVTIISFLNLGLAGFVLAAIAARFIFPSRVAGGTPDVAAALEPARPDRHALEQVLDRHGAAAGAGGGHHHSHQHDCSR